MILVIYPKSDLSTQKFISYLTEHSVPHTALDIDRDIPKSGMIIKDTYAECIWSWPENTSELNFNTVTGIYNRVYSLEYASFLEHYTEDVEYVQTE